MMAMSRRPHPAQKALNVWRSRIKPSSTETPTVSVSKRKAQSQRPGIQDNFIPCNAPEGRVFRRLLDSYHFLPDPVEQVVYPGLRPHQHRSDTRAQTVHVVAHDPIKVPTCCNAHKEQVKEEADHHRRYLYNSPTPTLPDLTAHRRYERSERLAEQNLSINHRRQLPLSTIVVRWRNSGRAQAVRAYDTETLYELLSEFGSITAIYTTSPSSAYVVFPNLSDACRVIEERTIGRADNRLYCHWLHKNMSSKLFYLTSSGLRVRHDDFIQPSR